MWNQVFSGVEGAPDDAAFPNPPYTTLDKTPLSREKPYLFVDDEGPWKVRVPAAQQASVAPAGPTARRRGGPSRLSRLLRRHAR